jgi:hypothetical protein
MRFLDIINEHDWLETKKPPSYLRLKVMLHIDLKRRGLKQMSNDITLCKDATCPFSKKCHRFVTKSYESNQSYFIMSPLIYNEANEPYCEQLWEIME